MTNTHVPQKTSVSGTKIWNDSNDADGVRPTSIIVNLLADGKLAASKEVKADASGAWKYSFTNLDQYADGQEIVYTITENAVEGYETTINGYNILNTHTTTDIQPDPDTGAANMLVHGEIIWEDNNDKAKIRPSKVAVRLYQGDTVVQQIDVQPDMSGNWNYSFQAVPIYSNSGASQQKLQYSLKQDTVPGYVWSAAIIAQETVGNDLDVTTRITNVLSGTEDGSKKPGDDSSGDKEPSTEGDDTGKSGNGTRPGTSSGGTTPGTGGTPYRSTTYTSTVNIGGIGTGSGTGISVSDSSTDGTGTNSRSTVSDSLKAGDVKTGDETNIALMLALMGLSLMTLLSLGWFGFRRRRK